jgi:catechol 2,3-dioxygenase-like lactoylglutathione lyase family enzyme
MEFAGVCLVKNSVPVLTRFYAEALGVRAEGDDDHVELHTEGASMTIFSAKGMESMAPGSMQGAGYGGCIIAFRVKDVDAEYERLQKLGVEFVKLPETHPWGARSVWFRDPDGNIVDFYADQDPEHK